MRPVIRYKQDPEGDVSFLSSREVQEVDITAGKHHRSTIANDPSSLSLSLDHSQPVMKKHKSIVKQNIKLAPPAERGIAIQDGIELISIAIANVMKRNEFVANLQQELEVHRACRCQDREEVMDEEQETVTKDDVFFSGLSLNLINKHLDHALPGASIFTIDCAPYKSDGDTDTSMSLDDFSIWYIVEGTTNKNFRDDHPNTTRRPTIQSFIKEPGFLDCHPRKSNPKTTVTTTCESNRNIDTTPVMEVHDLMAISLASSSVYTRLGPRGDHWRTDRFQSDFVPYPLSWLETSSTRTPATTTTTTADDVLTNNNVKKTFSIGKKGTLLTSIHKVWGIRYATNLPTTTTTTTRLQATHMPDTSKTIYPPDKFLHPKSTMDAITARNDRCSCYIKGLETDRSNRARCRRYCAGALYDKMEMNNVARGPLFWDPTKDGDLDLDVVVLNQTGDPLPYTTTRISVRRIADDKFLNCCNKMGHYHASIKHSSCRKGNFDVGKMYGVGKHLHLGHVVEFATKKTFKKETSTAMCNMASDVLEQHFPHQVIAMRAAERALGILPDTAMTLGYDQSVNLGNASHFDVMDGTTGISVWTELKQGSAKNWYFVIPNLVVTHNGIEYVGVIIKLDHGIAISWDGRVIRHCTSVTDVGVDNCVFGTFWAAKAKLLSFASF